MGFSFPPSVVSGRREQVCRREQGRWMAQAALEDVFHLHHRGGAAGGGSPEAIEQLTTLPEPQDADRKVAEANADRVVEAPLVRRRRKAVRGNDRIQNVVLTYRA